MSTSPTPAHPPEYPVPTRPPPAGEHEYRPIYTTIWDSDTETVVEDHHLSSYSSSCILNPPYPPTPPKTPPRPRGPGHRKPTLIPSVPGSLLFIGDHGNEPAAEGANSNKNNKTGPYEHLPPPKDEAPIPRPAAPKPKPNPGSGSGPTPRSQPAAKDASNANNKAIPHPASPEDEAPIPHPSGPKPKPPPKDEAPIPRPSGPKPNPKPNPGSESGSGSGLTPRYQPAAASHHLGANTNITFPYPQPYPRPGPSPSKPKPKPRPRPLGPEPVVAKDNDKVCWSVKAGVPRLMGGDNADGHDDDGEETEDEDVVLVFARAPRVVRWEV